VRGCEIGCRARTRDELELGATGAHIPPKPDFPLGAIENGGGQGALSALLQGPLQHLYRSRLG
jgi:hypothetical protein